MELDTLKQIAEDVLKLAKIAGATSADTEVSYGTGQNVSVRLGEVENIEYNRDKGVSVTVYFQDQKGHASSSDLSPKALHDTVQAACNIAKYTAKDPFCGLADANLMATNVPDLSLSHPWAISVDDAIAIAKTCEAAARDVDTKRITNSEGANVYSNTGVFAYANSHGFNNGYPSTRHSISCSVIAEQGEAMQRDYWYTNARAAEDLESASYVGRHAGERTIRRLGCKPIKTGQYPVLFEAPLAGSLISSLISAISGGSLYRKSSFLLDSLGKSVGASLLNIQERPHVIKGSASSPFDSEGVATHARDLVKDGVLQGYVLSSYSARKLGLQTTGNAGGVHNLFIQDTQHSFDDLLKLMGTGLLVTEVLGHGLNMVTGDYSRGAAGFWVENGIIVHPVEEITIAGNMKEMLLQIIGIGTDVIPNSSKLTGSILIERMTVAASE
ncbi:MAG: metalloprotease PmbA [Methylophilaceae bacterium 17-44-8]|nr:MAG: metalloprotease PmbA [Methylophilales bacterium 28-44-11]OYZ03675.1 MAG: metalloprotease PmbA [Methylophilales bacterium 16-45-7]OZA06275.1 MAG: metalloprotease PmbA [Methylophilaceae bacterium 17-44-8]